jgi:probable rRNA maturation factor
LSIKILYDKVKFRTRNTKEIINFLEKVIRDENKIPGDLYFIFTNDAEIIKINREFLKHDYNTDVIAFGYSEDKDNRIINGEIYISTETVERNADIYKVSKEEETYRVMIHGILHLCGYEDRIKEKKEEMSNKQEKKLKEFMMSRNDI